MSLYCIVCALLFSVIHFSVCLLLSFSRQIIVFVCVHCVLNCYLISRSHGCNKTTN